MFSIFAIHVCNIFYPVVTWLLILFTVFSDIRKICKFMKRCEILLVSPDVSCSSLLLGKQRSPRPGSLHSQHGHVTVLPFQPWRTGQGTHMLQMVQLPHGERTDTNRKQIVRLWFKPSYMMNCFIYVQIKKLVHWVKTQIWLYTVY